MLCELFAFVLSLAVRILPGRLVRPVLSKLHARRCRLDRHLFGRVRLHQDVAGQKGLVGKAKRCVLCGHWVARAQDLHGIAGGPLQ